MARETYRNGDPITLQENGCDGCSPMMINKTLVHEHGCPDSWRDYKVQCKECGTEFYLTDKGQKFCSDHCAAMYNGVQCDCEMCRELDLDIGTVGGPDQ
jgi:phage terminase large subunit GpA-like protein